MDAVPRRLTEARRGRPPQRPAGSGAPRGLERRRVVLAGLAFALVALCAEVAGIGVIRNIDLGRRVASPGYAHADYYPPLLAAVKVGIALLAAGLVWRILRARAIERTGRRLLEAVGRGPLEPLPRLRVQLAPRHWTACFLLTSTIYLVQADAQGLQSGRWPLLEPLLHTSALPVFAVLSIVVAVVWSAVAGWVAAYEGYARETLACGRRLFARLWRVLVRPTGSQPEPGRRLFGDALHQRAPPPQPA